MPVICSLVDGDVAATGGTSLTPDLWGNSLQQASLCVGGTGATMYGAGSEGTLTTVRQLDAQHVHPQSGYGIWFPDMDRMPRVAASRFLRIRCKAPAIVNVLPWIIWAEPSL